MPQATILKWLQDALVLRHIWASPNFVWSLIALLLYAAFPYDLSPSSVAAQNPISFHFFWIRFPLWATVTFAYTAFWHVTLHWLHWAKRPFVPSRPYVWARVAHNMCYSLLGVAIWVAFENVFAFLWATGRLAFVSNADAVSSVAGCLRFAAGLVLVPLWRDIHFYFSHRLLHYRPVFQHVHALHHRNIDPEPFAGLCMHPVEHLYYFSCVGPSIVCYASPFHLLWNGIHLLLSPAAGHSGFEDHFQAGIFHYMHHRYLECNYGASNAGALDVAFGTFVSRLREGDASPAGARSVQTLNAKATLQGAPSVAFCVYLVLAAMCVGAWALVAASGSPVRPGVAAMLALGCGVGPLVVAGAMSAAAKSWTAVFAPFHARPLSENILHLAVGGAISVVPIVAMAYLALVAQ